MTTQRKDLDRRMFMRGALAAAAVVPLSSMLAACAGGGSDDNNKQQTGTKSSDNPFGMPDKASVDAVIFDGGYGTDYVSFAAAIMEKNHSGSSADRTEMLSYSSKPSRRANGMFR